MPTRTRDAYLCPRLTVSAIHLGPLTIRSYAIATLDGIAMTLWLGDRR
jgi:prolipoprotein diacylglyceryltransferase